MERLQSYEPLARIDGNPENESFQYFLTNLTGLSEQLADEQGNTLWRGDFYGWGSTLNEWHNSQNRREQNLRYQGQYLDRETGLHFNLFRFYEPSLGRFTQPDPIGLLGSINLYHYSPNPITWTDPLGLISVDTPGYSVYGLYDGDPSLSKPYYIGITDDLKRRAAEHEKTGRLPRTSSIAPITSDLTYGQARGQEQYFIEKFETRTGIIGEPISSNNRGNKYNSFDHSRIDERALYFKQAYNDIKIKSTKPPATSIIKKGLCP